MSLGDGGPPDGSRKAAFDSQWDSILTAEEAELAEAGAADEELSTFRVRWWLLAVSGLAVVLLTVAAWRWYDHQLRRHSAVLLQRALEAQDKNDWAEAADWLSQYVQYVPDDVDRVRELADRVLKHAATRDEFNRALRLYDAYLDMRPDQQAVRAQVANILLVFNPRRALEYANRLRATNPNDVEALRIRAVALDLLNTSNDSNEDGKLKDVILAYQDFLEQAPGDVENTCNNAFRYATLCRQHMDRLRDSMGQELGEMADEAMDRMVEAKPNDVAARLARFNYRLAHFPERYSGDSTQLDEDLRVALEIDPEDTDALFAAAAQLAKSEPGDLIKVDRLVSARKYLRDAIENKPKKPQAYLLLGSVASTLGDQDEALAAIQSGLEANPNNPTLLVTLAEFQIGHRQWQRAWETLETLSTHIQSRRRVIVKVAEHWQLNLLRAELSVLQARWYVHRNNPDRNLSSADEIVDRVVNEPIPLTYGAKVFQDLGNLCAVLGRWEDAVAAYKNATVASPRAVSPRLQLVTALLQVGRFEQAASQCRQLTERQLHPEYAPQVWLAYTRLLLEQQLSLPRSERLWRDFDRALGRLKQTAGNSAEVQLVELDAQNVRRGLEGKANIVERLRSMETEFHNSESFWRGAMDFYLRLELSGDAQRAVSRLQELSENPQMPSRDGHQDLANGSSPSQSTTTNSGASDDSSSDAPLTVAKQLDHEFRQAVEEERYGDAFRILRDWRTQLPSSVQPRVELSRLASILTQAGELKQLEQGLRTVEGDDGSLWRFARVQRLLGSAQSDNNSALGEATQFTSSWLESHPDQLPARLAAGMVSEASGRYEEAIGAYKFVLRRGNRGVELTNKLASLLLLTGHPDEAERTISHLTSRQRLSSSFLPLVVQSKLDKKETEQAVQDARLAVDLAPYDSEAHVWLGNALLERREVDDWRKAETAFARAVALAPADVSVLVAAIHSCLRDDRLMRPQVLELYVRRAVALIGAHDCPTLAWEPFVVARCLQLQGDFRAAESFYRQAIHADPETTIGRWLPPGAIVTLKTSMETKKKLDDRVVWAAGKSTYQTLGLLVGALGSAEAPELLNLLDNDPRLNAIVALARAEKGAAGRALQQLTQIPVGQVKPGDRLLMGELCRRQGKTTESRKHLERALDAGLSEAELRQLADSALRHGMTEVARQTLDHIEQRAAGDRFAFALRIRWLATQGNPDRMIRFAEDTVRRHREANQRAAWGRVAADTLSYVGRSEEARALFEFACRRHPERKLLLATWLATQPGLAEEVLPLCDELIKDNENDTGIQRAAILAVISVQRGHCSSELIAHAEALAEKALSKNVSTELLLNLSRLREIQGRIDEAIALGKRALQQQPNSALLNNNMAWYLGAGKGQYQTAMELVNSAIRRTGPLGAVLDTKGVVLWKSGDTNQAVQLIETATLGIEASSSTYLHLAGAYRTAGREHEAQQALAVAKRIGLDNLLPFDVQLATQLEAAVTDGGGWSAGPARQID